MSDEKAETTKLKFGQNDDLGSVIETLSKEDEVILADRTYPMEVIETGRERVGSDQHETTVVYLSFRGRTYRLRGDYHCPSDYTTSPSLELRKEETWEMIQSPVGQITIDNNQQIISDTTAGDWLAESGIDIR